MTVTMSTSGAAISSATSVKALGSPVAAAGLFGAGLARVGDTDDVEALGERAQRRNMGSHGPAPVRLKANDANLEALSWHGVQFSFASPCLENTHENSMRKFGIYASDP